MHKLKVYISSIIILLLITCKEKSKDVSSITGIFFNDSKNQYAIVKDNKLLYPFKAENKFKIRNKEIFLDSNLYTQIKTDDVAKNFDSIEISYNSDNYESLGIKEFDAKINQNSVTFYDVENNITKKIELDDDFKKWINVSLDKRKMDLKNIDKTSNKFFISLISYKNQKSETIYSNAFNNSNDDLHMFITLLYTYLSMHRDKAIVVDNKQNFRSSDFLNTFIDKNNFGIRRVPPPPMPMPIK
jgi:hypothetical protein